MLLGSGLPRELESIRQCVEPRRNAGRFVELAVVALGLATVTSCSRQKIDGTGRASAALAYAGTGVTPPGRDAGTPGVVSAPSGSAVAQPKEGSAPNLREEVSEYAALPAQAGIPCSPPKSWEIGPGFVRSVEGHVGRAKVKGEMMKVGPTLRVQLTDDAGSRMFWESALSAAGQCIGPAPAVPADGSLTECMLASTGEFTGRMRMGKDTVPCSLRAGKDVGEAGQFRFHYALRVEEGASETSDENPVEFVNVHGWLVLIDRTSAKEGRLVVLERHEGLQHGYCNGDGLGLRVGAKSAKPGEALQGVTGPIAKRFTPDRVLASDAFWAACERAWSQSTVLVLAENSSGQRAVSFFSVQDVGEKARMWFEEKVCLPR